MIPDQITNMKHGGATLDEHDQKVWCRTMRFMVSLRNHLVTNDQGVPMGAVTKLVIGNSRKITQNQVHVSKLKWRLMFEGHPMMDRPVLDRVFQIRSRRRTPL